MSQRLAQYKALRQDGYSYREAAQEMGVSREAICQYVRLLREKGDLPPLPEPPPKPEPTPREPRAGACKAAALQHLRSWPDSWFSAWELRRILGMNADRALDKLAAEGLVETADGLRYPSDRKVWARRYRLADALARAEATDA
jgi:hypothetical protein